MLESELLIAMNIDTIVKIYVLAHFKKREHSRIERKLRKIDAKRDKGNFDVYRRKLELFWGQYAVFILAANE